MDCGWVLKKMMNWQDLESAWSKAPDATWDPYIAWLDARNYIDIEPAWARIAGPDSSSPAETVAVALEIVRPPKDLAQEKWTASLKQLAANAEQLSLVGQRFATLPIAIEDLPRLLDVNLQKFIPRAEISVPLRTPPDREQYVKVLREGGEPKDVPGPPNVFAAIIDDGCAFANSAFLLPGAKPGDPPQSRVEWLWFQEDTSVATNPNRIGFSRADLQAAIGEGWDKRRRQLDETKCYRAIEKQLRQRGANAAADSWKRQMLRGATHGTHLLDVMAGGNNPLGQRYKFGKPEDAASGAPVIFVQLPRPAVADTSGVAMTASVFEALTYIGGLIGQKGSVVVNLSYGALAGPHDGTTILEEAIDDLLDTDPRFWAIVLPAGNGYESRTHSCLELGNDALWAEVSLRLMPGDPTPTFVELWYDPTGMDGAGSAVVDVELVSPDGTASTPVSLAQCKVLRETKDSPCAGAVLHVKKPVAGGGRKHMALVAFAPTKALEGSAASAPVAQHGVWTIRARNRGGQPTVVDAWIERDDSAYGSGRSRSQAVFLSAGAGVAPGHSHAAGPPIVRQKTLNSFAHGRKSIVVAGCSLRPLQLARYSASGPGRKGEYPGVDVVAPCEDTPGSALLAAGTRSTTPVYMNGTSVAAAVVSRQCINAASVKGGCLPEPDSGALRPPPDDHPAGIELPDPALRRGRGLLKPFP
jgi:hypothetical protein